MGERANTCSDGARIEIAGRLVGQQDARRIGDRARDGDALLLAAGKLRRAVRQPILQPEIGQQLGGARRAPPARQAADHLRQHHVLHRREFRQQMVKLIDEADLGAADARALQSESVRGGDRSRYRPRRRRGVRAGPAMCSSVDLPAPDGATSATDWPGHTASSAPLRMSSVASP